MTSASIARTQLQDVIQQRAGGKAETWLEQACEALDLSSMNVCAKNIRRILGSRYLVAAFADREHAHMKTPWGVLKYGQWRIDEAARIWLFATVAARQDKPFSFLFQAYDSGETETRVAALKAINFVEDDDIESGLELVRDAGRTYLDELLTAAWCNHPFSTANLTNLEYRKAVLKALFCEVSIDGFLDLEARADEEMAISLNDFANEREAAGRGVPDSVWIVSALRPRPGLVARLVGRLEHPLPRERLVAARALKNAADPRAKIFLEERLVREDDAEVAAAIREAIETSGSTS